jgi:D-glycero-alpha-D-manno-heptose-7-phosphate kinase
MIITRTPFRISFFGGGTDYPKWYEKHGGAVLSTTIDKYCYITCRSLPPFFEHKHRIVYSHIENVKTLEEIKHPAVAQVLQWAKIVDGLEIHHDGDLPARSGLGSSSAFTVGLIHALYGMRGKLAGKERLALDALHIEQNLIGESVGSQDQVAVAHGGFNKINFHRDGAFDVEPVILTIARREELQSHLMLCFTGFSRIANEIAKSKIENFDKKEVELLRMGKMVDEALNILSNNQVPIEEFGLLLDQAWKYKRNLSEQVSTPEIDFIYEEAKRAGAIGGKILGAGGGGFMLLFAKPEIHASIRERLKDLIHVDFKFEDTGSKVVLYQPDGL